MTPINSVFFCTLCLSMLAIVLAFDHGKLPLDPSRSNKAQVLVNPYFSSVGEGNYQDYYDLPRQTDSLWKRVPSAGFYGMRGKKAPSRNFYGVRGKKGPIGFLGVRGKKMDGKVEENLLEEGGERPWMSKEILPSGQVGGDKRVQDGHGEDVPWEKRVPTQGFMGLRGRRSLQNGYDPLYKLYRLH